MRRTYEEVQQISSQYSSSIPPWRGGGIKVDNWSEMGQ